MYTYQDLQSVSQAQQDRMAFVKNAIDQHKTTELYETARIAEAYNRHQNVTISEFKKLLYTITGKAIPDNYSANFKMGCRHFHRFIVQEVQYLLGNGATWSNEATEDKLGTDKIKFDNQLQDIGRKALVGGVAFGFFNLDHLEVFSVLEFVPLYDEETGSLSAGIRFWQIADDKPLRATLYELDGYTDYLWDSTGKGKVLHEKRAYKLKVRYSEADGAEIYDGENYPSFPIVPLWGNLEHQSEIVGLREQIDCYDLIKSGFANTVDEASIVYWTIQNAGGMDDVDLAKFVERIKTVHAAAVGDDGSGAHAESHMQDAPYASREALLARLDADLYRDAMALDTNAIAGGAVTATQIRAAYEPLNAKADDFEYCVLQFIAGILAVAGIDDEVTFTRSALNNGAEDMANLIQAAQFLPDDYVTRKALEILGDGDKAEDILKQMAADELDRMQPIEEETEDGDQQSNDIRAGGVDQSSEAPDVDNRG